MSLEPVAFRGTTAESGRPARAAQWRRLLKKGVLNGRTPVGGCQGGEDGPKGVAGGGTTRQPEGPLAAGLARPLGDATGASGSVLPPPSIPPCSPCAGRVSGTGGARATPWPHQRVIRATYVACGERACMPAALGTLSPCRGRTGRR